MTALLAAPAAASAAAPADPALSHEAKPPFSPPTPRRPGVIVKPDGLQIQDHPERLRQAARRPPTRSKSITPAPDQRHGLRRHLAGPARLLQGQSGDPRLDRGAAADARRRSLAAGDSVQTGLWRRAAPATAIPPDQMLVFDMTLVSTTPAPRRGEPGYIPDPNDPEDQQQQ